MAYRSGTVLVVAGMAALADVLRKQPDAKVMLVEPPRREAPLFDLSELVAADIGPPSRGPQQRRKYPVRR